MPPLSGLFLRAALAHLVAGFALGAALLVGKGLAPASPPWALLPAHLELALVGWTLNLAMGVAYWILPRFGEGPRLGRTAPARAAFALLNAGVLAVALGGALGAPLATFAGRLAEAAAAAAFALHAWPRVKPFAVA